MLVPNESIAVFTELTPPSGRKLLVNKVNLDALPRPSRRPAGAKFLMLVVLLAAMRHAHASEPSTRRSVVKKIMPSYPPLARSMHVYGTISLTVSVLANGHVDRVSSASGHPLLIGAAEEAVRQWVFVPSGDATTEVVTVEFTQMQH
jgi:TonB family protein